MRPILAASLFAAALTACDAPAPANDPLPLMGGYRDPADACRRVGEDAFTNRFLDDSADLVGCPDGAENIGVFVTETGAVEVARHEGWILYSVPRG